VVFGLLLACFHSPCVLAQGSAEDHLLWAFPMQFQAAEQSAQLGQIEELDRQVADRVVLADGTMGAQVQPAQSGSVPAQPSAHVKDA